MLKGIPAKRWIKFGLSTLLYILFCLWMQNGWLLIGIVVWVDLFLTQKIHWTAWKEVKNPFLRISDVLHNPCKSSSGYI